MRLAVCARSYRSPSSKRNALVPSCMKLGILVLPGEIFDTHPFTCSRISRRSATTHPSSHSRSQAPSQHESAAFLPLLHKLQRAASRPTTLPRVFIVRPLPQVACFLEGESTIEMAQSHSGLLDWPAAPRRRFRQPDPADPG